MKVLREIEIETDSDGAGSDFGVRPAFMIKNKIEKENSMSKYNPGDQFVIEIADTYKSTVGNDPIKLYRIKGFASLVFDEKGLDKLIQIDDYQVKRNLITDELKSGDIIYMSNSSKRFLVNDYYDRASHMYASVIDHYGNTFVIDDKDLIEYGTIVDHVSSIL